MNTGFFKPAERSLQKISGLLDNKVLKVLVAWLVVLSIVSSMEDLPDTLKMVIKSHPFKILITFIGVFMATKNVILAAITSVALLGIFYISVHLKESFELIKPIGTTSVYTSCMNVTLKEILALFDNNVNKCKKALYEMGVPLNIALTDDFAPLIATYLVNYGYIVNAKCNAPGTNISA